MQIKNSLIYYIIYVAFLGKRRFGPAGTNTPYLPRRLDYAPM